MSGLRLKLAMLDNSHKAELGQRTKSKSLRVFYGWAKRRSKHSPHNNRHDAECKSNHRTKASAV